MKQFFLFAAAFLSAADVIAAPSVPAEWRSYHYRGPSYRWGCAQALMGVENVLSLIGARQVKAHCSGNYGLQAQWEALAPVSNAALRERVNALLSAEERRGAFPALASHGGILGGRALKAHWQRGTLHYNLSDIRSCNVFVEVLDSLLQELPVRNVHQTVFCNTGSSYVYLSLEYLESDENTPR